MRELIQLHEAKPFEAQIERVTLAEVSSALNRLKAGNAEGRLAIVFATHLQLRENRGEPGELTIPVNFFDGRAAPYR
jgi:hypothetical protein